MSARLAPAPDRTRADFLAFVEERPDEERWELIDEVRVMQAGASVMHQIIVMNIARVLNDMLERQDTRWFAIAGAMVDLTASSPGNMYIPDVLVIDTDEVLPDQNTTDRCYAAVEIISRSGKRRSGKLGGRRKIDVKVERYGTLPSCGAILVVAQDRMEARILVRSGEGWTERLVDEPDGAVEVEPLGLSCRLRDLYRRVVLPAKPRA